MSKKLLLLLGNGFTLDWIDYLKSHINEVNDIDASNFFKYGAEVPWPETQEPGFLSYKHCPNLWNLGARPNMDNKVAYDIIEDIITCVNVYASHPKKSKLESNKNDIYFAAYLELLAYLRSLFVFYNQKVDNIPEQALEWTWAKYLKKIYESSNYEEINVVTYNYDIWLERILERASIPFSINGFSSNREKIEICKPHGSISFKHGSAQDKTMFQIKYDREIKDAPITEFSIDYDRLEDYHLINALIPPAGETNRLQQVSDSWSRKIHQNIIDMVCNMDEKDQCIICGLSYWHVDRNELDSILVNCHPEMNVKMINPNPTRAFTAVLTSLFSGLVIYPKSEILERLI